MTFDPADLADPDSSTVQAALAITCKICHARPQNPCRNTIQPEQPLPRRTVHYARATGVDGEKEQHPWTK